MYGLAAIEQANGWAMAAAGACIVLCGLTVLSFLISLLPRIPGISDDKKNTQEAGAQKIQTPETKKIDKLPDDINSAALIISELTEALGESFDLVDLHKKCKETGLPNPHMTINSFRQAGILKASESGQFSWQLTSD